MRRPAFKIQTMHILVVACFGLSFSTIFNSGKHLDPLLGIQDAIFQPFLQLPTDDEEPSTMAVKVVVDAAKRSSPKKEAGLLLPLRTGVLSHQNVSFFRQLQQQIDDRDPTQRCLEYGFRYNPDKRIHRRIFYGALIADESWELLDIISTEAFGIFSGIVFVESNRTQNLTPRPFHHLNDTQALRTMFRAPVQIRTYVQESRDHLELEYEHMQRQQILRGWKELGMEPDDVGMLSDTDEMFTRDFLRAVQTCDQIKYLMYNKNDTKKNDAVRSNNMNNNTNVDSDASSSFAGHFCQHQFTKLIGATQIFESSPECITDERTWFHPDMILGHCVEGIGDHVPAPRDRQYPLMRAKGYGSDCNDYEYEQKISNPKEFPSWNAADFRRGCGGGMVSRNYQKDIRSAYTAYHFHNFFISFNATRFKQRTYGHPDVNAMIKSVEDLNEDLQLMYRCIKNIPDNSSQSFKRVIGGFDAVLDFRPIYFHDNDYRRRRHAHVQQMIEIDEKILEEVRAQHDPVRDTARVHEA